MTAVPTQHRFCASSTLCSTSEELTRRSMPLLLTIGPMTALFALALTREARLPGALFVASAFGWPLLVYVGRAGRRTELLHPVVYMALLLLVGYPLQVIQQEAGYPGYSLPFESYRRAATVMVSGGFIVFCATFLAMARRRRPPSSDSPGLEADTAWIPAFVKVLTLLWLSGQIYRIAVSGGIPTVSFLEDRVGPSGHSSIGMLFGYASKCGYVAIACTAAFWPRIRQDRTFWALFILAISVHLVICMGAGAKVLIIAPAIAAVIGIEQREPRFSAKRLLAYAAALACIVFAFETIMPYRLRVRERLTTRGDGDIKGVMEVQVGAFADTVSGVYGSTQEQHHDRLRTMLDTIGQRLNGGSSFARVISYAGGKSPHEGLGSVLLVPAYAFIPRDLLPSKTRFLDAGRLAHMAGWRHGGLAPTLAGSLFWVGGPAAVLLGYSALGLALSLTYGKSRRKQRNAPVWLALHTMVLMSIGTHWDSQVIDGIRYACLFWLCYWLSSMLRCGNLAASSASRARDRSACTRSADGRASATQPQRTRLARKT